MAGLKRAVGARAAAVLRRARRADERRPPDHGAARAAAAGRGADRRLGRHGGGGPGTAVVLARFRLLMGLAEELVEAALDLLVPGLGDVAIVDAVLLGEHRRLGVRGGPGIETATLEAIRRRRWQPAADARLPEGAIASDRSLLVTGFD